MNAPATAGAMLLYSLTLCAQTLLEGPAGAENRLFPSSAAGLRVREANTSLPCVVKPERAEMGFDLAFHTGYQVRLRLKDLAREGGVLTIVFRVIPGNSPWNPVYFEQTWNVPPIPADAEGKAELEGEFTVGEGDYQVEWSMRDGNGRVCLAGWKISVRLPAGKGQVAARLAPGSVISAASSAAPLRQAVKENARKRLRVALLVHIASQDQGAAIISAPDKQAFLSVLGSIASEPRIGGFSVTAFNLDKSRVIFSEHDVQQISFADLEKAVSSLSLGTVSVDRLAARDAGARFLTGLAAGQATGNDVDAVIFLGPRIIEDRGLAGDMLTQLGEAVCPAFYLSFNPAGVRNTGADLIGSVVKHWRGDEFSISKPLDLVSAWQKIMERIDPAHPADLTRRHSPRSISAQTSRLDTPQSRAAAFIASILDMPAAR